MKSLNKITFQTILKIIFISIIGIFIVYHFPDEVNLKDGGNLNFKPIGYLILLGIWIMPNYYLLVNKILTYKKIFLLLFLDVLIIGLLLYIDPKILTIITFIGCGVFIVYHLLGKLRRKFTKKLGLGNGKIRQDILSSIFIVVTIPLVVLAGAIIYPTIILILIFTILERKKLFGDNNSNTPKKTYISGEIFIGSLALIIFQLSVAIPYILLFFSTIG